MTKRKSLKVELLKLAVDDLTGAREILKGMGKPISTIRKMDDAIDAIKQVLESLEPQ